MTGTAMPFVKPQWSDSNGNPLSGAKLFSYLSGSSTKATTYSDAALTVQNSNPIILDSAGRASVFLSPGVSLKFVMSPSTDSDPPVSPLWTVDAVSAVPASGFDIDVTGTAGEALVAGELAYLSAGDGARTAGRWYKADADFDYMSITANAMGFVVADIASAASGSIRMAGRMTGLSSLSIGTVYYVSATAGAITASPTITAKRRRVGVADSTTSLIMSQWLPTEPYTLSTVLATVGNVGAGEDILATYTLPAATLNVNSMSIRGIFWGKTTSNVNVKTLRIRSIEGANNTILLTMAPAVSETGHWIAGFMLLRTGAATSRSVGQAASGPTGGPVTMSATVVAQPVVTWANACEIRVTGDATTDNDITIEGGAITFVPSS